MARLTTKESPKGFWPHPDEEYFYKTQTPPWKVPKERKSRGSQTRFHGLEPNKTVGEEIITYNRFSPLADDLCINTANDMYTSSQDTYENTEGSTRGERKYTQAGQCAQERNPAKQEDIVRFVNDIPIISKFSYDNEYVYSRGINNNILYNLNKNNYAGYNPNFIIPNILPDKTFMNYEIFSLNKVDYK